MKVPKWMQSKGSVHETYHKWIKRIAKLPIILTDPTNHPPYPHGYEAMVKLEKYAENKEDIFVVRCDDAAFAGSDIFLIVSKNKNDFMGTEVMFVPQCTPQANAFFLYPHHLNELVKVLQKIQKMQKKYKVK